MKKLMGLLSFIMLLSFSARAEVLMSPTYAEIVCEEWNYNEVLTEKLDKWMENDLRRGYKVMLLQRLDCPDSPIVQLTIQKVDGLVWCTYGGEMINDLDPKADYFMKAKTKNWIKMGRGDLGPAGAMLTGRLKFEGPKGEAMANMGPFKSFLRLFGEVEGDGSVCP